MHHITMGTVPYNFDYAARTGYVCNVCLRNNRVVWGPLLVARCVKCALHVYVVYESVNEVII